MTGKPLTNVVSIGIGGSALGPLFVHTALATEPGAAAAAAGRSLVFLANVDPVDAVSGCRRGVLIRKRCVANEGKCGKTKWHEARVGAS